MAHSHDARRAGGGLSAIPTARTADFAASGHARAGVWDAVGITSSACHGRTGSLGRPYRPTATTPATDGASPRQYPARTHRTTSARMGQLDLEHAVVALRSLAQAVVVLHSLAQAVVAFRISTTAVSIDRRLVVAAVAEMRNAVRSAARKIIARCEAQRCLADGQNTVVASRRIELTTRPRRASASIAASLGSFRRPPPPPGGALPRYFLLNRPIFSIVDPENFGFRRP